MAVIGVDISDRCIEMAGALNPNMRFRREDMMNLSFGREVFDGVVSYYSNIHTPKKFIGKIFHEFNRVLRPDGYLLVAVKAGEEEKYIHDLLGMKTEVYFSLFQEREIECYFKTAGFTVDFIERRNPYDSEIMNERIFALGRKLS